MGRKTVVISMALVLLFAMVTMASAAVNVTSTSQKGSLLVFPKVVAIPGVETYLFIGNDASAETWVKCYWMDNNQTTYDFMFKLTPNQPIVITASTGANGDFEVPPFAGIGTLICFAQDENDRVPRDFDHLYGTALIREALAWVYYDAFSFAARGATYFTNYTSDGVQVPVGDPSAAWGQLNLTGDTGYDTCPKYLVENFIPDGSNGPPSVNPSKPDLTLWPCKQDLRQDRIPTCTKAKFDIWNENEVKFTGAYQCFKCFFEGFLTDIGYPAGTDRQKFMYNRGPGYGGDKFSAGVLKTNVARMRVQGVYSSVCISSNVAGQPPATAKTKAGGKSCPNISSDGTKSASFVAAWGNPADITPLLGVLLYADAVAPEPIGISPKAGLTMHGAGTQAGSVKFDLGGGVLEKAVR